MKRLDADIKNPEDDNNKTHNATTSFERQHHFSIKSYVKAEILSAIEPQPNKKKMLITWFNSFRKTIDPRFAFLRLRSPGCSNGSRQRRSHHDEQHAPTLYHRHTLLRIFRDCANARRPEVERRKARLQETIKKMLSIKFPLQNYFCCLRCFCPFFFFDKESRL